MMTSDNALSRLCEEWRQRLAEASKEDQSRFAEGFLGKLGWRDPDPVACPGNVSHTTAVSYLLQRDMHGVIAAHFVLPHALKTPAALAERGLDFCENTRVLVNATRAMNVRYALITDLYKAYLYDAVSDALLISADAPEEIERELAPILDQSRVTEGVLDDLRRAPRSQTARQFREWAQRWCDTLMQDWQASEETAWTAIDRLILLRYMSERDALHRTGWRLRHAFVNLLTLATGRHPRGAGAALAGLCRELATEWNAEIFGSDRRLDAILAQDELAIPLLQEFCLLSRAKFQRASILESFNYGDAAEKARVRMIPEEDPERTMYLARQRPDEPDAIRLEIDLQSEGYLAIPFWLDRVLSVYEQLEAAARTGRPANDDLIAWSEADARRPAAFSDPLTHLLERAVTFYYASPRQYRTARLIAYLYVIDRCRAEKKRLLRFPAIGAALRKRPAVLESDRRMVHAASQRERAG